jgi:hypothetical protein
MSPAWIASRGRALTIATKLRGREGSLLRRLARLRAKLDRFVAVAQALPDLIVTLERTRCADCERQRSRRCQLSAIARESPAHEKPAAMADDLVPGTRY